MQELISALAGGDTEAFGTFWAQHREQLYRVCLHQLNGNHADAEEALSRAMLKTWERLPLQARELASPAAWTRQLTRNVCIDLLRERRREARKAEEFRQHAAAEQALAVASGLLPASPSLAEARTAELRAGLERLPPRLREVLELRLEYEWSSKAIARRLNLTAAGVRKRLQEARARLGRALIEPLAEPPDSDASWLPGQVLGPAAPPQATRENAAGPPWEITQATAFLHTVCVRLSCQVERYFTLALAQPPFRARQKEPTLRAYVEKHPRSFKKRQEWAWLLYQTGAWAEAMRVCRRALAEQPAWLSGARLLGEMLFLTGNWDEAATTYALALPYARQAASRSHLQGLAACCHGRWPQAVRHFEAAAEAQPVNPAHWHALAFSRQQAGSMKMALAAFERALHLNPDDRVALSGRHGALLALGRAEAAGQGLEQLLALAPDFTLAPIRPAEGQVDDEARWAALPRAWLRRALRLAPNSPTLQAALAAHHLARDEPRRALLLVEQLWQRYPGCPRIKKQCRRLAAGSTLKIVLKEMPSAKEQVVCNGACALAGIRAGL
jgi:RNA polymerase sigma-70 factor (ECF subfamily)